MAWQSNTSKTSIKEVEGKVIGLASRGQHLFSTYQNLTIARLQKKIKYKFVLLN